VKDCFRPYPPAALTPGWGRRLSRERLGLGIKRSYLAHLLCVDVSLIRAWESEICPLLISYQAELSEMGLDVGYIASGHPSPLRPGGLTPQERYLLYLYRGLTEEGKDEVLAESGRQRRGQEGDPCS